MERAREVIDFSAFNAHHPVLALIKTQTLGGTAGGGRCDIKPEIREPHRVFHRKYADES